MQNDSLVKHALAVEGVMVHFSEIFNALDKENGQLLVLFTTLIMKNILINIVLRLGKY